MTRSTRLSRVLGTPALVLFGLAYMVPLTVFTTYGLVSGLTEGHVPGAYLLTLGAMLFTAYGYGQMARVHPSAGSAYAYAQQAFGGHVGFLVGWMLLLDYVFLPMINYLVIGIFVNAAWPAVPGWVWVVGSIVVVTVLNVLGIRLVAGFNLALVAVQGVFIVVFVAMALRTAATDGVPALAVPFFGGDARLSALLAGAAVLCLSFLGFDAISTLSEEAREPARTIPRAIMLVTLAGGVIFILLSYAAYLAVPDHHALTDPDSAATQVIGHAGGPVLVAFFTATYVAGCFGSALAAQASVARILYAMGRDGVLPRRLFGTLHRRFQTPVVAIVLVGLISTVALAIGLDLASAVISFGALAAFSTVNLAVIKHFLIDGHRRSAADLARYGLVPVVGVVLTLWLWASLSATTFVVGLVWTAIGTAYVLVLTRGLRRAPPQLDLAETAP